MCDVTLLSNRNYHVVAAAVGSGRRQYGLGASSDEIACHATSTGERTRFRVDGIDCAGAWVGLIDDDRTRVAVVNVAHGLRPAGS